MSEAAPAVIETDALIVGAGPVGLFQVFELGLQDLRAQVVDSLPRAGGQCVELYADKPIYDIPAVAVCTGRELVDRLLEQIAPFRAGFHLGQEVRTVARREDGRFDVETSAGTRFVAGVVVIAAGVGSFQPKRLRIEGLERFEGSQVFYRVDDAAAFAGKQLVITGGGDSALDWALHFAQDGAAGVTLVHRRDQFSAVPATVAKVEALRHAGRLRFLAGQVSGFDERDGALAAVKITGSDGAEQSLPADSLLVFHGLTPRLGPIADWGLALERRQLAVDTASFRTSVPGIFAVGDVVTYPGKRKLIVSGFHEAALAAFGAAAHLQPDQPALLQYTTTSPKLHRLLGVDTPPQQPE